MVSVQLDSRPIQRVAEVFLKIMSPNILGWENTLQESTGEYRNIVTSHWWEPTDTKEKSQNDHLSLDILTGAIEEPVIKTGNKADIQTFYSEKDNDSGG